MTIDAIIKSAGGAAAVAEAIATDTGKTFKADAVYKWPKIGIPDRHWQTIIRLSGCTAQQLFEANLEARGVAA